MKKQNSVFEHLKDSKKGQTVVLIGNGPSLAETDLELLKEHNIDTVAMNRISLKFKEGGWRPTWYFFSSTNVKNPKWGKAWTNSVRDVVFGSRAEETTSFVAKQFQPWIDSNGKSGVKWFESMSETKPDISGNLSKNCF